MPDDRTPGNRGTSPDQGQPPHGQSTETQQQTPQGQPPQQSTQGQPPHQSPGPASAGGGFDWVTLEEGEQIEWAGEPHFYSILPALVIGLLFAIVLIGIPIAIGAYLNREHTDYVITTKGLYRKRGILSRDVQQIEFDKIQNISFNQGPLGNYFGYGSVDISTAGGSGVEMQFRSVPDPKSVQERINRHIRQQRSRSEGDEETSKAEILDEILVELQTIRSLVEGEGTGAPSDRAADRSQGHETAGEHDPSGSASGSSHPSGGADEHADR